MNTQNALQQMKKKHHLKTPVVNSQLVSDRALLLIENGHYEEADLLVSSELLFSSGNSELWLLAGLARFQKGNLRTAMAAFKMSAWIEDNPLAREMMKLIQE